MVSDYSECSAIDEQMEMFTSPHYSQTFTVSLRVSLFNTDDNIAIFRCVCVFSENGRHTQCLAPTMICVFLCGSKYPSLADRFNLSKASSCSVVQSHLIGSSLSAICVSVEVQ